MAPCSRLAALAGAALFFVTAATAQPTTSASVEYLMTVYLPKDATLGVDSSLAISHDPEGGWVKGKVSGTILTPSADWVRIVPSDGLRLQLDGRVTIETEEHEIIYMSYNGRMHCDKETADRFRKGDALKGGDCYLVSAPTFQTKSAKYAWLNDVQAVGKMAEFKPGKGGHLIYDLFVIN
jgi:Protein of unknown function (DUF3237)